MPPQENIDGVAACKIRKNWISIQDLPVLEIPAIYASLDMIDNFETDSDSTDDSWSLEEGDELEVVSFSMVNWNEISNYT